MRGMTHCATYQILELHELAIWTEEKTSVCNSQAATSSHQKSPFVARENHADTKTLELVCQSRTPQSLS
jgi:hypothetical protein